MKPNKADMARGQTLLILFNTISKGQGKALF